jgi:hypothetical protein
MDKRLSILKDMKITKSNRFYQSTRLDKKARVKSIMINIYSFLSLIVSVYLLAYADVTDAETSRFVAFTVVAVSLISLATSLDRPVHELIMQAREAHECGRRISTLYSRLKYEQISAEEAAEQYELVLSSYSSNHDKIDYGCTINQYKSEWPESAKNFNFREVQLSVFLSVYASAIWPVIVSLSLIFVYLVVRYAVL